ncbi:MAG: DUF3426 domain-containing protein [Syntrophobacteraceae bacterium]
MATLVIKCRSCGTKFRLDSERLNKTRNRVRCSKCHEVFTVDQPDDEDDLIHIEISDDENSYMPDAERRDDGDGSEAQLSTGSVKERFAVKKFFIPAIITLALILVTALIFQFVGRSKILAVKKVPVQVQKPIVTISDKMKAYYLESMSAGEVLVIEGEVSNKSSKPVSFVMIQGQLFNRKDTAVLTQSCYAGNPLTRNDIIHLKFSEIQDKMLHREGQNLKDVRIPPSGVVPFVLVFHDLPEISTLTNYSVKVVSSQFE